MLWILVTYVAYAAILAIFIRVKSFMYVFLLMQGLYYIPVLFLVDYEIESDMFFFWLHMSYFALLVVSAIFWQNIYIQRAPVVATYDTRATTRLNWIILIAGCLICLWYYQNLGGSILFREADGSTAATMRLESYAEESVGAGYVNQFKNVLLPMTAAAIAYGMQGRARLIFLAIVGPIILYFLLGTGQRFPVIFVAAFVFLFLINTSITRIKWHYLIAVGVGAILLFSYLTVFLGRGETTGLLSGLDALLERIFLINPTANITTFPYLERRGFVYGLDWWQDLIGLSPWAKGSTISNELFGVLWVSTRGNSPPSVVSSLYYNFSLVAVLVAAVCLPFLITYFGRILHRSAPSISRIAAMIMLILSFGAWIGGSALAIFNKGGVTIAIYLVLLAITEGAGRHRVLVQQPGNVKKPLKGRSAKVYTLRRSNAQPSQGAAGP